MASHTWYSEVQWNSRFPLKIEVVAAVWKNSTSLEMKTLAAVMKNYRPLNISYILILVFASRGLLQQKCCNINIQKYYSKIQNDSEFIVLSITNSTMSIASQFLHAIWLTPTIEILTLIMIEVKYPHKLNN